MSDVPRIGLALFGLGRAGTLHANNLIKNSRVHFKYIVEEFPKKALKFVAENFLDTQVVRPSEIARVLDDNTVQAVVVTTPTDQHEKLILLSLQAGKSVFCEKPIASTYDAICKFTNITNTL